MIPWNCDDNNACQDDNGFIPIDDSLPTMNEGDCGVGEIQISGLGIGDQPGSNNGQIIQLQQPNTEEDRDFLKGMAFSICNTLWQLIQSRIFGFRHL